MKLEINRESAQALYQLSRDLPAAMSEVVEQTVQLINLYQSLSSSIGPHGEQFMEMGRQVRYLVGEQSDAAGELAQLFKDCADRIMAFVDANPAQPELVLKKR